MYYQLVAPFARSSHSTCGSVGQAELIYPSRRSVKVTESKSKPPTGCVDYAAGTVTALIAALHTASTPQEPTKPAPYPDLDNHARLGQSALIAALHSARAPQEPTQPAPYPDLDRHSRLMMMHRLAIGKPIRFSLGQSFPFSQTTRLKRYSSQSGDFGDNNGVSLPQSGDFGDNNGVSLSNLLRVSEPFSGSTSCAVFSYPCLFI